MISHSMNKPIRHIKDLFWLIFLKTMSDKVTTINFDDQMIYFT